MLNVIGSRGLKVIGIGNAVMRVMVDVLRQVNPECRSIYPLPQGTVREKGEGTEMIDRKPDSIEKGIDQAHKDLQEEEKAFCPKCRPMFRRFLKRWFEQYPSK